MFTFKPSLTIHESLYSPIGSANSPQFLFVIITLHEIYRHEVLHYIVDELPLLFGARYQRQPYYYKNNGPNQLAFISCPRNLVITLMQRRLVAIILKK